MENTGLLAQNLMDILTETQVVEALSAVVFVLAFIAHKANLKPAQVAAMLKSTMVVFEPDAREH